ncbi:MAG: class C sortase [Oscillospiraceae bacterium]|nr:class C sortase [Oscillospiraceae bacterium]
MNSKKKTDIISTVILLFILLVGLSVMFYPTVSDWWNSRVQSRAIANYDQTIQHIDPHRYDEIWAEANEYNKKLAELYAPFSNADEISGYDDILDLSGTGIMGYITIPVIKVELPVYHGTSAEVLNIAAGHLKGSSLPVGGKNTHAVISAHRGLPSARLFTDLDQLVKGDTFTITILDQIFTYEVEEILIVNPDEMDKLSIIPDGDYVTLMTCTPYGVNTHRLLIRSHRIDTVYEKTVKVIADAVQVDPMLVVPVIAFILLIFLIIFWIVSSKNKPRSLPYKNLVYILPTNNSKDGD